MAMTEYPMGQYPDGTRIEVNGSVNIEVEVSLESTSRPSKVFVGASSSDEHISFYLTEEETMELITALYNTLNVKKGMTQ